jgi:hypothetical protein
VDLFAPGRADWEQVEAQEPRPALWP